MKLLGIIALLIFTAGCDPYNFGFKKNPAYVLDEAFKAINKEDQDKLLQVTGKEALCIYGNLKGVQYLHQKIVLNRDEFKLVPGVISKKHFKSPIFVGYWSYYQERYMVDVLNKNSGELLVQTVIDCEFGIEGEKDSNYKNKTPDVYPKKECKIVKLIPKKFEALPMTPKCNVLRIDL